MSSKTAGEIEEPSDETDAPEPDTEQAGDETDAPAERPKLVVKGLSRRDVYHANPLDMIIIGLDTDDGWEHPQYDPRIELPINEKLIADIRTEGVLVPVIAARDGDGRYIVVDGRQRIRAARALNERDGLTDTSDDFCRVPFMIRGGVEKNLLRVTNATNELRTGDDPLTRANKMQRMVDFGHPMSAVAVTFGFRNPTEAQAALRILDLAADAQDALRDGKISFAASLELAKASRKEQKAALATLLGGGVRPTRAQVKRTVKKKDAGARGVDRRRLARMIEDTSFAETISDDARAILSWVTSGDFELLPETIRGAVQSSFDRAGEIRKPGKPAKAKAEKTKAEKSKKGGRQKPTDANRAVAKAALEAFNRGERVEPAIEGALDAASEAAPAT